MDEFVEVKAEFGKLVHVRQHGGKATPEGVFIGTVHLFHLSLLRCSGFLPEVPLYPSCIWFASGIFNSTPND
jgi:hypothetical protein